MAKKNTKEKDAIDLLYTRSIFMGEHRKMFSVRKGWLKRSRPRF